jgi:hypothetical protein
MIALLKYTIPGRRFNFILGGPTTTPVPFEREVKIYQDGDTHVEYRKWLSNHMGIKEKEKS